MEKPIQKYFLAANSCQGFYSAFTDNYSVTDGWQVTLIKGGPGTGKSSFMRHLAAHGIKRGEETVLCACSSDPQSLDGVIFPERKKIVLDATAPHTVEPRCVGVCENIVDLGAFWSREKLQNARAEILTEAAQNKHFHAAAARHLAAAGQLMNDRYKIAAAATDTDKVFSFAKRLAKQYLPPVRGNAVGREWVRFIEGTTPKGILSYPKTVTEHFDEIMMLTDSRGSVSAPLMAKLREEALRAGYDILTLKNPFFPETRIDHLLIPERSLAFVTESAYLRFDTDARRIHDRRFMSAAKLQPARARLTADKRLARELLREACRRLALAKESHDRLERCYVDAMDFPALTAFAEDFTRKFF